MINGAQIALGCIGGMILLGTAFSFLEYGCNTPPWSLMVRLTCLALGIICIIPVFVCLWISALLG